jgi:endonuclease/exonuclease/phosphatase family metal-dependent hydrolase
MRIARPLLMVAALSLAAACSDESSNNGGPLGLETESTPEVARSPLSRITVMTRNMYVGANVDAVIAALITPDPADDQAALLEAISTLQETAFPARAAAIAEEIAGARPHVIGLQEVSKVDITLPPLGIDLHLDFLPTLLAELEARGLHYDVAARVTNIQAAPFAGVSLVDEDALLVDPDRVEVHGVGARSFSANIGPVAPGLVLARGWVSASVTVDGKTYTIASTHLESGDVAGLDQLRAAQAIELAGALSGAGPTILVGDLNDVPGSLMYQVLSGAGFSDVWAELRGAAIGYTCCHQSDLSNQVQQFDERIDYVLVRDAAALKGDIWRVGEVPAEDLTGPAHRLWSSDHAGLVASLFAHDVTP